MEELYAELLLCYLGFLPSERYEFLLDEKFLNAPENAKYLELEECCFMPRGSMELFQNYWAYECKEFDQDLFGMRLFSGLKLVFDANTFEISEFGDKCCRLWHMLPEAVAENEPFLTLIYADDPLAWGDDVQTRKLYEEAFAFYADAATDE